MSAYRKRKRRQEARKHVVRRRLIILGLALSPFVLVAATLGGEAAFSSSCDLSALRPVAVGQNSVVYASDGSELGVIPAERNRTPVSASAMSPWISRATVAIEDRRFYRHGGIDPIGIARAVVADVEAGKIVQGGSTITQELVRNLYLSRARTFQRKLTEACLAIKLGHDWSKQKILTAYLNQIYYGNHAYGIEAAAETYFSEPARSLTLDQAALLAGLPQAPSVYDPVVNPSSALFRRDAVLHAMLVNGDISNSEYDIAHADRSLGLHAGSQYTAIREPYFFSYVEDLLQQEYGTNTVREGGLKVYTTIRPGLQKAANAAVTHVLNERTDPASAIVAIDPATGAIRAMTAVTPGKTGNQFNFVTSAARQPGSTFKTIALATAVSEGVNPFTTDYLSAPFYYAPLKWNVQTYEHTYKGVESLESATIQSDNTVYARLALDVGPANIVAMARKLGIRTSPLTANPSIALGAESVTPLEEASAYATLAAQGIYSKPMAITKVVFPDGKADTDAGWGKPQRQRVVPDWVASTVTQVLEQNMLYGTGTGAHVSGRTDAGKTGTTDNYADAWFSGYTPTLEATVWIGYPQGEVPMLDVHGIAVSGPTFPADIWHLFMESATAGRPNVGFPAPKTKPVWQNWHGEYEYGYAYSYSTPSTTTTSIPVAKPATSTTATAVEPTTTAVPTVTIAPPPTITAAPPATTDTTQTTTTTPTP
ncbi:MAG TPA: transglycosylase domain-containing protein [Gaiellaceae bacterium]|nr:transglycosylase domain-containing protein [Gaiellaceae bacterium]